MNHGTTGPARLRKPASADVADRLREYLPVLATALVGLTLSVAIALAMYYRERDEMRARFESLARSWELAVTARLQDQAQNLQQVAAFVAGTHPAAPRQLRDLLIPIIENDPVVETIAWHPRVLPDERMAYEMRNGPLLERDVDGSKVQAGSREAWFPREVVEPAPIDRGISPTATADPHSNTLQTALATRQSAMTPRLGTGPDGETPALTVYEPVYGRTGQQEGRLLGVVSLTFRINSLFRGVHEAVPNVDRLAVRITDVSQPEASTPVYGSGRVAESRVIHRSLFRVPSRQWQITVAARDGEVSQGAAMIPWAFLVLGLLATALLALQHLVQTRRAQGAEQQMARNTQALLDANADLRRHSEERERALQALRESEARYRLLADNASDIIARQTPEGDITYISPAVRNLLGYDPDELAGRCIYELMHEEDAAPIRKRMGRALADNASFAASYRIRHRDGHHVWLEAVHRVLTGAETGRYQEVLSISRDITARREAERALRESESLFRKTFESSAVGMAYFSVANQRIIHTNHALAGMLGYSTSELEEMTVADITHPADQELTPSAIQQVLSGAKESFVVEKRYLHKNGSTVWILGNTTLIRHADGEPRFFLAQIQDISDRKRAEQKLAQLSRQQDLILNAAAEGIYGVDMDGYATFTNRAATEILGFTPGELVGRSMHDLVHHSHPDGSPHDWRESRIHRSIQDRETHYVDDEVFWHRDGHPIHVQYVSSPIIEQDRAMGAVIVFSEVDPQQWQEEPRQQERAG